MDNVAARKARIAELEKAKGKTSAQIVADNKAKALAPKTPTTTNDKPWQVSGNINNPEDAKVYNSAVAGNGGVTTPIIPKVETPLYDPTADINKLAEAQKANTIAQLQAKKNSVLSGLNAEESTIEPKYQKSKMTTKTNSQLGARNFREYLDQKGLTSSGVAAQGEINRIGALQRDLGDLNEQENQAYGDIARRRTDAETAYQTDLASAYAGIDANTMQQLINARQTADTTNYNRGRDAKADYVNTINQFGGDYQAEINKVQNDGDPSNDWQIPLLQSARTNKIEANKAEEIKNIGQYYDDIQAKIDEIVNDNDTSNDYLLPYLKQLRVEKLAELEAAEAKAQQQAFENAVKEKELALKTAETNYAINKPYYNPKSGSSSDKPTATELKNQDMASDYSTLKSMSVSDAVNAMNGQWGDMISRYGPDGAKQLWNTVLADAIYSGQATAK